MSNLVRDFRKDMAENPEAYSADGVEFYPYSPQRGKKNPGRAAANRLAVGPKANNWKGGHASGDNRRAYLTMKAKQYRDEGRYAN